MSLPRRIPRLAPVTLGTLDVFPNAVSFAKIAKATASLLSPFIPKCSCE